MSKTTDGGPAFPSRPPLVSMNVEANTFDLVRGDFDGMSLRDWFAGQAICGRLATDIQGSYRDMAADAYLIADLMLAARERPKGEAWPIPKRK